MIKNHETRTAARLARIKVARNGDTTIRPFTYADSCNAAKYQKTRPCGATLKLKARRRRGI